MTVNILVSKKVISHLNLEDHVMPLPKTQEDRHWFSYWKMEFLNPYQTDLPKNKDLYLYTNAATKFSSIQSNEGLSMDSIIQNIQSPLSKDLQLGGADTSIYGMMDIKLFSGIDQSLTAHTNRFVKTAQDLLHDQELDENELSGRLNEFPIKSMDLMTPREAYIQQIQQFPPQLPSYPQTHLRNNIIPFPNI